MCEVGNESTIIRHKVRGERGRDAGRMRGFRGQRSSTSRESSKEEMRLGFIGFMDV